MTARDAPDPAGLPRQRRGVVPQMRGRFPDFDVLEQAPHWDEVTRRVVLDRVERIPPLRFFAAEERPALATLCDVLTAQDAEPRIPVLNLIDDKYARGELDGYQHAGMPEDGEAWRLVARGLDEEARRRGGPSFAELGPDVQHDVVSAFSGGDLTGGAWEQLDVSKAFALVMRVVVEAFYSHPWAWNEIGFGGPAYPRGYSRFGSPHLEGAEREAWEGEEAFAIDPVRDVRERGMP